VRVKRRRISVVITTDLVSVAATRKMRDIVITTDLGIAAVARFIYSKT
jgi:hypothetical protein